MFFWDEVVPKVQVGEQKNMWTLHTNQKITLTKNGKS